MSDLIGKTFGPYRILEQIGVGGMATVYRAYQPSMDRDVAIKVLPHYLSEDRQFAERFQREAHAIAKLEHAHILPVYDYGASDGVTYIAMRYVHAGTLKELMSKGRLSLDEINRLIGQIGSALDYAHSQGVIHRDIKPSNVLIDDQGNTYLTDFGLARMLEASQQLTASGVGVGTPAYMSPEQGQGIKVDHRSDLYSLGVMLYEMVTGRVPYEAETPMAVVLKHITEPLPLPRAVAPNVPEVIEKVILRAMAKDPAHRFQSACDLVQALNLAVRKLSPPEPVQPTVVAEAMPTREHIPLATRIQRLQEKPRNEALLVVGAAVLLAVLGLLFGQLLPVAPRPATSTTAASATRTSATDAVAATAPPSAASPIPAELTLTLRLRLSSTSDWAELALLSSVEIVEASTVESSLGATLAAMDVERRTIDLDQSVEAGEAGEQVSMVLDLVLAGVPSDWDLRFNADKGCLGTLKVEIFNLSVGEPVPIKDYIVEGCNPPFPRLLNVPAIRLAEVMTQPPDSGTIAVWCDERWPGELCMYDPRTDRIWDITADFAELFPGDHGTISWSPDGQRWVYSAARKTGEPQKLYWVYSDGTGGGQITTGEIYDHEATWSPDGQWIAFHRDCDLWLVRPDGSEAHPVVDAPDYCAEVPAWSPDGRKIAYLSHAGGIFTGIWVVSAEGGAPHRVYDLSQIGGASGAVAWTPDGRKLLHWSAQKDSSVEHRLLVFADGRGVAGDIEGVPYWWQSNFWPQWGGEVQTATTDVMPEQARAFAEPILKAIADRKPDFEDDFSTADKGWGFAQQEGSRIQDGVARLSVKEGSNTTGNTALNRKDFVLSLDARVAEGDKATQLIVNFHNLSGEYWFYLVVNSAGNTWLVDKNVPGDQLNLANGVGNVSPFGKMTNIMIVARGPRAAIYLNGTPVAYFDDADFDTSGGTGLFCQSLGQAVCEFDNVKFWNLDNVPGLP